MVFLCHQADKALEKPSVKPAPQTPPIGSGGKPPVTNAVANNSGATLSQASLNNQVTATTQAAC